MFPSYKILFDFSFSLKKKLIGTRFQTLKNYFFKKYKTKTAVAIKNVKFRFLI